MSDTTSASAGTFLTFSLDVETYALSVSMVKEVLEFTQITRVPRMPDYMRGVINLRGSVVPVIDLRLKFGLPETTTTVDTSIVVTEITLDQDSVVMGLLTDSVNEVIDIDTADIEPAPQIGTQVNTDFIQGMGRRNDDFIIILDIEKILNAEEVSLLYKTAGKMTDEVPSDEGSEPEEA